MKAFVTGGSGFIGRELIAQLVHSHWQVRALVRSQRSEEIVTSLGAEAVYGSLQDQSALCQAMQGCDVLFHIAGVYGYRQEMQRQYTPVNIYGTENVLQAAVQAGVGRIVYTSSIAVLGDTHGEVVDESHRTNPPWTTAYDRSKWLAHYRVVEPLIQQGAPVVVVMPGGVYGQGDPSVIADLFRLLYRGILKILPGSDTRISFVHVEDTARGMILAAERGRIGESYLLVGEIASFRQVAELWSELSGRRLAYVYLPGKAMRPLIPLAGWLAKHFDMPAFMSPDALRILGTSYTASSAKAMRELGWQPRPLRAGFEEALNLLQREEKKPLLKTWQKAVLIGALLLAELLWLLHLGKPAPRQ